MADASGRRGGSVTYRQYASSSRLAGRGASPATIDRLGRSRALDPTSCSYRIVTAGSMLLEPQGPAIQPPPHPVMQALRHAAIPEPGPVQAPVAHRSADRAAITARTIRVPALAARVAVASQAHGNVGGERIAHVQDRPERTANGPVRKFNRPRSGHGMLDAPQRGTRAVVRFFAQHCASAVRPLAPRV